MGRGSAEVPSAATPLRAGLTVGRSRQQTRASLKVAVRLMGAGHTEWIGNDKSASRLISAAHLAYTALTVEMQSLPLPKSRTRKFVVA
jgi:hypothetical protein